MRQWQVKKIRQVVGGFQDETVSIYAPTRGVDDSGAAFVEMGLVASGVAGRLIYPQKSNTSAVANIGDVEKMRDEYRLSVPIGTPMGIDYEVGLADGTRFKVVRIIDNLTDDADLQAIITRRR